MLKNIKTYYYVVLSLIFTIPFLPAISPGTATIIGAYYFRDALSVFISIIIILSFILNNTKPLLKINLSQLLIFSFIILLVAQLAFIYPYKSYSFEAIIILFIGLLLSIAISNYQDKDRLINLIVKSILLCVYVQIALCILQLNNEVLNLTSTLYSFDATKTAIVKFNVLSGSGERIGGGLNQSNNLADLLTWGLFANIFYWYTSSKKYQTWLAVINLLLISFFISITYSRIVIIFAIFILFYSLVIWSKDKKAGRIVIIHGIILSLCILCTTKGYFNFAYNNYNHPSKANTSVISQDDTGVLVNNRSRLEKSFTMINSIIHGKKLEFIDSDSQRITLWQRGWKIFKEYPLLGAGWNCYGKHIFDKTIAKNTAPLPQLTLSMNAHNLFIQLLATTGIIGFSISGILIILVLYYLRQQPIIRQILPLGIIITLLLHSQVEYPLFYVPFLYCFLIMVAIIDDSDIFTIKQIKSFKIVTLIISFLALWQICTGINNFLILAQLKRPSYYIANNPLNNIISKYRISLNPLWSYYVDADITQKIHFDKITKENQELFNIVYKSIQNVEQFTPYPSYDIKLAYLEILLGNQQAAGKLITKVLNNYPNFADTIENWVIEISQDNPQIKKELLREINNWKNKRTAPF